MTIAYFKYFNIYVFLLDRISAIASDSGLLQYRRSSVICLSVCLSVCRSVYHVREPCKTAELIDMSFGAASGGPKEPRMYWVGSRSTPHEKAQCLGIVRPTQKHWQPLLPS